MLDFWVLLRCGMEEGLRLGGGLGVSGFGGELGRLVCRRGGREGGRKTRACGCGCGLESSWKCASLYQTRQ